MNALHRRAAMDFRQLHKRVLHHHRLIEANQA